MIKLTQEREITPYPWVRSDDDGPRWRWPPILKTPRASNASDVCPCGDSSRPEPKRPLRDETGQPRLRHAVPVVGELELDRPGREAASAKKEVGLMKIRFQPDLFERVTSALRPDRYRSGFSAWQQRTARPVYDADQLTDTGSQGGSLSQG
jgi:hypothetical protein